MVENQSENSSKPTAVYPSVEESIGTLFRAADMKNVSEYTIGDDIRMYIPLKTESVKSIKADYSDLEHQYLKAGIDSLNARILALEHLAGSLVSHSEFVLRVGELVSLSNISAKLQSQHPTSSTSNNKPDATAPADRKTRLEGVDVAALPAGFGKRRGSSAGGAGVKRPRTPVEPAPALDAISRNVSPESNS